MELDNADGIAIAVDVARERFVLLDTETGETLGEYTDGCRAAVESFRFRQRKLGEKITAGERHLAEKHATPDAPGVKVWGEILHTMREALESGGKLGVLRAVQRLIKLMAEELEPPKAKVSEGPKTVMPAASDGFTWGGGR